MDGVRQSIAGRMRHRDVRDQSFVEEALVAREGAVDELVDHHEMPGGRSSRNDPQAESDRMSVTPTLFRASMLAR